MRPTFVAGILAIVFAGAMPSQNLSKWTISVETVEWPAAENSGQPQLTATRTVLLSWVERSGSRATLKFAERTSTGWSAALPIASGDDWFVNWADVPSVIRLSDGTLVAHWLQKSGSDTYAYDVRMIRSSDGGKTWSPSFVPHSDGTKTEHGFAAMFEMPQRGLGLIWLDGRRMKGGHEPAADEEMSLQFGRFDRAWKQAEEIAIDTRVCECPTAAAVTSDGPIVAYRDRGADEMRDISVVRLDNGRWTRPMPLHVDGWRINACPVNGPSLSARGRQVVAGWFTARDNQPKSFAAFSADAGRTFGPPIRLDDAGSLGRVDVELLPDGTAAAAYIEFDNKKADFRVRRVSRDGTRSEPFVVSAVAGNRTSGYPRMAVGGDELVFAWVDRTDGSRVKTAVARLPR